MSMLSLEMDTMQFAWGMSFEPALSQVSIASDFLSKASFDPSMAIPWWDKSRLLLHGNMSINMNRLNAHLMAARDPHDETEKLELDWKGVEFSWTTCCFKIGGDLDVFVRTASKYDECQVIHFPGFQVQFDLEWICLGHPHDHHAVMPCSPAKVPNMPPGQVYDTFVAFRSQNLNMKITMEVCHGVELTDSSKPKCLLFASTLRFLQQLQLLTASPTRPIRRGPLFDDERPLKLSLGSHYNVYSSSVFGSRVLGIVRPSEGIPLHVRFRIIRRSLRNESSPVERRTEKNARVRLDDRPIVS
eukprot:m.277914 g.277914  ORF g.277914 m.277914 type:complete len:301 (+) comp40610_c1_seq33:111-1013(+)